MERFVVVWSSLLTVSPATRSYAVKVTLVMLLGTSTLYWVVVPGKVGRRATGPLTDETVRLASSTSEFTVAEPEQS